jgi:hypothetical protein
MFSTPTSRHLDGFGRRNHGRSSLQKRPPFAARLRNAVMAYRSLSAQVQDQKIQFIDRPRALSAHTRHPSCGERPHGVVMNN